jgi:hypothetical protein
MFLIILFIYFLSGFYVLLSILCVLCFCIILCIVSLHAYSCLFSVYNFTDYCHRVETQFEIKKISYLILFFPPLEGPGATDYAHLRHFGQDMPLI